MKPEGLFWLLNSVAIQAELNGVSSIRISSNSTVTKCIHTRLRTVPYLATTHDEIPWIVIIKPHSCDHGFLFH